MDVSFLPSMWNINRLLSIKGTSVYVDSLEMRKTWEINARKAVADDKIYDGISITTEQWLWARASLQCRAYRFANLYAFFPFIGFCNHNDKKFSSFRLGKYHYATIYHA